MDTNKLRNEFLSFFESKGHRIIRSDSLVPKEDPTLLFTSAGMNQFKDYFLGKKKDIKRAASCQRCLRTGDLDRVGVTPYHHTFFEMLGNFSFGDYFKQDSIVWAWEFLTKRLNLKEKDLWVSVYQDDDEAYGIWQTQIQVVPEKISRFGPQDNFWPANALLDGPNGPCGPCSEIFFDWGVDRGCQKPECNPSCSCGRFVEIWNLVFTQFNRVGVNETQPLPFNNIDTGMGLERMSSVLQGKASNFEIDIFQPIVDQVKAFMKTKDSRSVRAIADHVRAVVFAISDGVYPSNEDRGYVIRRILRRALWFGFSLGRKKPFLYDLVAAVSETMKQAYPEVCRKSDIISQVIRAEEERFLNTLDKGKQVLSSYIAEAVQDKKDLISAEEVFTLYDTYGFPYELTESILKQKGLKSDFAGFEELLEKQRKSSRQRSKFQEGVFTSDAFLNRRCEFIGYDISGQEISVKVKDVLSFGDETKRGLVLDKTPFYFTSGGQLSDKGIIRNAVGENSFIFQVEDVDKIGDCLVHKGVFISGDLADAVDTDLKAVAIVDMARRRALARAHTSTHLLQAALRKVLGAHVQQQGSLVDEDYFRFDFTHFKGLSQEEIIVVEKEVNSYILDDFPVEKVILSLAEAKKQGALAFFEEKYEEQVRVVKISSVSKELCGGIHLARTSQAGSFFIISESSISSGIRRVEAVTGKKAYSLAAKKNEILLSAGAMLKTAPEGIQKSLNALVAKNKEYSKTLNNLRKKIFENSEARVLLNQKSCLVKDKKLVIFELKDSDTEFLRQSLDILRKKAKDKTIILGFIQDADKLTLNISCTKDLLIAGFSCKIVASAISERLGGSGGGRDDFGFAGAKGLKNISEEKIKELSIEILGNY
ncbi:MAG: alanine--tRNA ligase [Candidatus Omnitrophica bacterium]|nr:alanine--tRNA ligase [Candidatus Omnitrophota bacterium]